MGIPNEVLTTTDLKQVCDAIRLIQEKLSVAAMKSTVPTVRQRADRVEHVLRAAAQMLEVDPGGDDNHADPAGYIQGKLNVGIGHYGLDVVQRESINNE